jgi:hypothetical protein
MKKLELYLPDNIYQDVVNSGVNLQQDIMEMIKSYKISKELEKVDDIVINFSDAYQEYLSLNKENLKNACDLLDEI